MTHFTKSVLLVVATATIFASLVPVCAEARPGSSATHGSVPLPPRRPVEFGGRPMPIKDTGNVGDPIGVHMRPAGTPYSAFSAVYFNSLT